MKLECDVIRDLLPLYAEKLASPASSALVEQHLAACPACRAELEQMEKPVPVQPEHQPDAPLWSIRKTMQKKSIRIAAAAVLAVLCALGLDGRRKNAGDGRTGEDLDLQQKGKRGQPLCAGSAGRKRLAGTGRLL